MKKYIKHYRSEPVGDLTIVADDEGVLILAFGRVEFPEAREGQNAIIHQCTMELDEYFAKKRTRFDVEVKPQGTEFQRDVWRALMDIPYGETLSYKDVARNMGRPKSCRAVGNANGRNPVPIIIPCHRVVAADGGLGGYSYGLEMKQILMELEGSK